jgi:uncharacterized Zn finger protein (UPF0148 family)
MAPNVFPVTCNDCGSPKQDQDLPCPNCGSVRTTVHAAARGQSFSSARATATVIPYSDTVYDSAELEQLGIKAVRPLTKSDLAYLAKSDLEMLRRSHERPAQRFNTLAKFLDLILKPDNAESAIVILAELYERRLRADPSHAQRWLVAQVGWIVFGRAMDVFRHFMRARAGK